MVLQRLAAKGDYGISHSDSRSICRLSGFYPYNFDPPAGRFSTIHARGAVRISIKHERFDWSASLGKSEHLRHLGAIPYEERPEKSDSLWLAWFRVLRRCRFCPFARNNGTMVIGELHF